jgi:pimeloyl-ACP methyl ester carboxylesterase
MPELHLDDVTLHYEISGTGPPLLMLAGMMSDSASWAPLVSSLEEHHTLIRPDNRTTGRTTPWDAPVSVELCADDALALLDHLDLPCAHVLGHSMGGMIAMTLARRAPERVHSLALAASAPVRMARTLALFGSLVAIRRSNAPADTWLNALLPWLFAPMVYDIEGAVEEAVAASLAYPYAQSVDAMAHQIEALAAFDPAPLKGPYPMPTQAFLAENDLLLPTKIAQAALDGINIRVLRGAGHSIHWDSPGEFRHFLLKFTGDA